MDPNVGQQEGSRGMGHRPGVAGVHLPKLCRGDLGIDGFEIGYALSMNGVSRKMSLGS